MEQSINMSSGYLEIILGSMYAGKTSRLIDIYNQCKVSNVSVAVINHIIDNRYDDTMLCTHDNKNIPCIKTDSLMSLYTGTIDLLNDNIKSSEIILINEGQFFDDLDEFVKKLLKLNKKIYVCGLDGDFKQQKFGKILDLIPLCDKVTKLTSFCSICKNGTPGIFTKRTTNDTQQMLVGSSDIYIPVCRKCLNN